MRFAVILVALWCACGAASAQQSTQPVLHEEQFVDLAERRHPALARAAADLALAEAARVGASALPNPTLGVAAERPRGGADQTDVLLEWSPPLDGRRTLLRQAAASGVDAAQRDQRAERLRVRVAARSLYADWWHATALAAQLGRDLERLEAVVSARRARAEAGEEAPLDVLRLGLEARRLRARWTAARIDASRAAAAVAEWAGVDAAAMVPDRPVLPELPADAVAPVRDDVAALELRVREAETERHLARRVVAFPRLGLGWQRIEDAGTRLSGPLFAVTWDIPLLDRGAAARAGAAARESQARSALGLARREAAVAHTAARAAYALQRDEARQSEAALDEADRAVAGMTAAFEAGERDVTDLLDTLRLAQETREGALGAVREAVRGRHELELALGRELGEGSAR